MEWNVQGVQWKVFFSHQQCKSTPSTTKQLYFSQDHWDDYQGISWQKKNWPTEELSPNRSVWRAHWEELFVLYCIYYLVFITLTLTLNCIEIQGVTNRNGGERLEVWIGSEWAGRWWPEAKGSCYGAFDGNWNSARAIDELAQVTQMSEIKIR
jgi:hypothetical protein